MGHTKETRQRDLAKMKARREAWLAEHPTCLDCGSNGPIEAHHRDPADKISNSVWSWSEPRRQAELAKCDPLCHRCHVARHRQPLRHGRESTYNKHGCRCEPCRTAKYAAQKRRRGRKERLWPPYPPRESYRDKYVVQDA